MNTSNIKIPVKVKGIRYDESIMCFLVFICDVCNYNCEYCYNLLPRTNKMLDLNCLYDYIIYYTKHSDKKIEIELIGGESMFNSMLKDFCKKLYSNKNITIKIYTNLSFDIQDYIDLLLYNVILLPSWHSIPSDLYNNKYIEKILKLIELGYNKQLDIRIMYEPMHTKESLNAFDTIYNALLKLNSNIIDSIENIEFSLLVDKGKDEDSSELYSYTDEQLNEFHKRVDSLNNTTYKKEYLFWYADGTSEYKCFNDLFGKNEYTFKFYLCDAKRNNLYIHFDGNVYPCVDYFSHNKKPLFNIYSKTSYQVYTQLILCSLKRCTCDWSITKQRVFKNVT